MNYLPSGQEDFKQIRENTNLIYIDKAYFIKEWWESPDKVTLIFIKKQIKMKIWLNYMIFKKQLKDSDILDVTEKNYIDSITLEMDDFLELCH